MPGGKWDYREGGFMQCRRPAAVFKYMSCRAKDFFSILRVHYTDSTDSTDSSPSQSPLCLPAITDLADCDSNDKKKKPLRSCNSDKNRSSTHTEIKGGVSISKVFKINHHNLWFCPSPVYQSEAGCGHHPRQTFTQKLSVDLTEPHTPKHTHTHSLSCTWKASSVALLTQHPEKKSEITRRKP